MDPVQDASRYVLDLLMCCQDDARDEVVDVHLKDVSKAKGYVCAIGVDRGVGGSRPVFELVGW